MLQQLRGATLVAFSFWRLGTSQSVVHDIGLRARAGGLLGRGGLGTAGERGPLVGNRNLASHPRRARAQATPSAIAYPYWDQEESNGGGDNQQLDGKHRRLDRAGRERNALLAHVHVAMSVTVGTTHTRTILSAADRAGGWEAGRSAPVIEGARGGALAVGLALLARRHGIARRQRVRHNGRRALEAM